MLKGECKKASKKNKDPLLHSPLSSSILRGKFDWETMGPNREEGMREWKLTWKLI